MALTGPQYRSSTEDAPRGWTVLSTSTVFRQAMIARYNSGTNQGYVDNVGASPDMTIVGISDQNGGAQAAGHTLTMSPEVIALEQILPMTVGGTTASITTANRDALLYGVDSNTVSLNATDGIPVGMLMEVIDSTHLKAGIGPSFVARAQAAAAKTKPVARAVITALGTYTYSNGTITANSNNETLTADGVTKALGDVYWLPPHAAAADADVGLYVLTADTGSSAKFVLTRHPWMPHGAALASGAAVVEVGGEGSSVPNMAGNEWKNLGASGKVGTDNLGFVPRTQNWEGLALVAGTYTLGHGGTNGEAIYLRATTRAVTLTMNTPGGTLGTNRLAAPVASRAAGNNGGATNGTAAIVINSYVDAGTVAGSDTSTVDASWPNW